MARRPPDDHALAERDDWSGGLALKAAEDAVIAGLHKLREALKSQVEDPATVRTKAAAAALMARYQGMARAAREAVRARLEAEADLGANLPDPQEAMRAGVSLEEHPSGAPEGLSTPKDFTKNERTAFRRVKEAKAFIDAYHDHCAEHGKELTREGLFRYAREVAEQMAAAQREEERAASAHEQPQEGAQEEPAHPPPAKRPPLPPRVLQPDEDCDICFKRPAVLIDESRAAMCQPCSNQINGYRANGRALDASLAGMVPIPEPAACPPPPAPEPEQPPPPAPAPQPVPADPRGPLEMARHHALVAVAALERQDVDADRLETARAALRLALDEVETYGPSPEPDSLDCSSPTPSPDAVELRSELALRPQDPAVACRLLYGRELEDLLPTPGPELGRAVILMQDAHLLLRAVDRAIRRLALPRVGVGPGLRTELLEVSDALANGPIAIAVRVIRDRCGDGSEERRRREEAEARRARVEQQQKAAETRAAKKKAKEPT